MESGPDNAKPSSNARRAARLAPIPSVSEPQESNAKPAQKIPRLILQKVKKDAPIPRMPRVRREPRKRPESKEPKPPRAKGVGRGKLSKASPLLTNLIPTVTSESVVSASVLEKSKLSLRPEDASDPNSSKPGSPTKFIHKVPPGTSVIIRKGETITRPPLIPHILGDTPSTFPVQKMQLPPISDLKLLQKQHSLAGTIKSPPHVPLEASIVVTDVVSASHVDDTVKEVSKGCFTRSLDSDSTLTASETETIERMQEIRRTKKEGEHASPKRPVPKRQRLLNADGLNSPEIPIGSQPPIRPKSKRESTGAKRTSSAKKSSTKEWTSAMGSLKACGKDVTSSKNGRQLSSGSSDVTATISGVDMESLSRPVSAMSAEVPFPSPIPLEEATRKADTAAVSESKVETPESPKLPYFFVGAEDFSNDDEETAAVILPRRAGGYMSVCSLPDQSDDDIKVRSRLRSISVASDGTDPALGTGLPMINCMASAEPPPAHNPCANAKSSQKKKTVAREVHKIGTMPLTDLGRWKPQDDMMLITAVQEYRDLAAIHRHAKFSCHFTHIEIQERWFNLLYNRKVSKSSCQAMRACDAAVMGQILRRTPFSEAEEALLLDIPLLAEVVDGNTFQLILEANRNVFPPFRTAEDLRKHWQVLLAEGRVENSDTMCTVPEDSLVVNGERIATFAEVESKMKDGELRNWTHVSGEFAYEMDKMQRQNRERLINLEKEIEHLRYLLERAINYELPDFIRPEFSSQQDRCFLAILLGQRAKFGMKTGKVSLGRSTDTNIVDIDLSLESYAGKVSRLQGYLLLERNGTFRIENHGRRPLSVDDRILYYGDCAILSDEAIIQAGDVSLQFFINPSRIHRFLRQRYYGEWLSEEELEDPDKGKRKTIRLPKKVLVKPRKTTKAHNTFEVLQMDSSIPAPAPHKKPRPKPARAASDSQSIPSLPKGDEAKNVPKKGKPRPSSEQLNGSPVPLIDDSTSMQRVVDSNNQSFNPQEHPSSLGFPQNISFAIPAPFPHPAFQQAAFSRTTSSDFSSYSLTMQSSHNFAAGNYPSTGKLPAIGDLVPKSSHLILPPAARTLSPNAIGSPPRKPRRSEKPVRSLSFQNLPVNPATPHIMHAPASAVCNGDNGNGLLVDDHMWKHGEEVALETSGTTSLVGQTVMSTQNCSPVVVPTPAKKTFSKVRTTTRSDISAASVTVLPDPVMKQEPCSPKPNKTPA